MNPLEQQLTAAAANPQLLALTTVGEAGAAAPRLEENLLAIHAELDAPREAVLARILRRLGVSDLSVPLVTATPALRRSWFIAVILAVFFTLSVASNNTEQGVDRIVVFLTLAPLLPLLGVALAFGKGVDPTHELVVAAPRDTFTVFLVRAITVLVTSSIILLFGSLLLPAGGVYRVAWLLPALAIASITMTLSATYEPRRVAAALGATWVMLVVIVSSAGSVNAMFGPATQLIAVLLAGAATAVLITRRERFNRAGVGV